MYEEAIAEFMDPDPRTEEILEATQAKQAAEDSDYDPNTSRSMDTDSNTDADASMSTSPVAPLVARPLAQDASRNRGYARSPSIHLRFADANNHPDSPSQREAADPSSDNNSDLFGSPLSAIMSSPAARRERSMATDKYHLQTIPVSGVGKGQEDDDDDDDEEMPISPSPLGRAGHNTGLIGRSGAAAYMSE